MATIRTEVSERNPYHLTKHRYLELKHFCLQYPEWRQAYQNELGFKSRKIPGVKIQENKTDIVGNAAVRRVELRERMEQVEQAAVATDPDLVDYILMSVTEGCSYTELSMCYNIPCSRNAFYRLYRRFFWILDSIKS